MTRSSCELVLAGRCWLRCYATESCPIPTRLLVGSRQGTREVRLSPGERIVLYTLAARVGAVVSYREIAEALGRTDPDFQTTGSRGASVACAGSSGITRIAPGFIETVSRTGYRFVAAPQTEGHATPGLVAYPDA